MKQHHQTHCPCVRNKTRFPFSICQCESWLTLAWVSFPERSVMKIVTGILLSPWEVKRMPFRTHTLANPASNLLLLSHSNATFKALKVTLHMGGISGLEKPFTSARLPWNAPTQLEQCPETVRHASFTPKKYSQGRGIPKHRQ